MKKGGQEGKSGKRRNISEENEKWKQTRADLQKMGYRGERRLEILNATNI